MSFEANGAAIGLATANVFDSASNLFGLSNNVNFDSGLTNFSDPEFSNFGQLTGSGFNLDFGSDFGNGFSDFGLSGGIGGLGIDGGFLLYPSKPNNNRSRQVYSK